MVQKVQFSEWYQVRNFVHAIAVQIEFAMHIMHVALFLVTKRGYETTY